MSTLTDVGLVVSLGVAGWAAYSSHQARRWQQQRDEERSATHVRIEVEHVARFPSVTYWVAGETRPDPKHYELVAHVINDGEAVEYLRRATVRPDAGDELEMRLPRTEVHGDFEVVPRGRAEASCTLPLDRADDLRGGFVVAAVLGSGATILSDRQALDEKLVESIVAHNRHAR